MHRGPLHLKDGFRHRPRSLLNAAKLLALGTAASGGIGRLVRDSRFRRHRLLILCYHGISLADEHEWDPELYMPAHALRRRFELLRDGGFPVLPLGDALNRLRDGTLPPHAVALTFDDGTHDFRVQAVPLLAEFGFPATVYVTSYYALKQTPVFRVTCRYLLWKGRGRTIPPEGLVSDGRGLEEPTRGARDTRVDRIAAHARRTGSGAAGEVEALRRLAQRVDVDFDDFLHRRMLHIMSAEQIETLPDLVDVQLHTHRHRVPVDRTLFRREIEDNRRYLQPVVSRPLDGFCYPSGVTNAAFLPWLRELGVRHATTCNVGLATPQDDPLMLPRLVDTSLLTRVEFEAWLTGVAQAIPRLPVRADAPPYAVD